MKDQRPRTEPKAMRPEGLLITTLHIKGQFIKRDLYPHHDEIAAQLKGEIQFTFQ